MEHFTSKDGTPIACRLSGKGAPLVLVHGTGDTHARWKAVLPALEERFRVYAMDRRGRGGSGDAPSYALEREAEDVAAVLRGASARCGEPAALVGHSYGGILSLEAALSTPCVARLVLYEPPLPVPGEPAQDGEYFSRLRGLRDAGDLEAIWVSFLRHVVRLSDGEVEASRASPSWKIRVDLARLLPREVEARAAYRLAPERFRAWRVPTLLVEGAASPRFLRTAVGLLHEALPGSLVASIDGESHVAMASAPGKFLQAVLPFLCDGRVAPPER
jgi:pimeloyl-ACP methyl ester carboxylesterase